MEDREYILEEYKKLSTQVFEDVLKEGMGPLFGKLQAVIKTVGIVLNELPSVGHSQADAMLAFMALSEIEDIQKEDLTNHWYAVQAYICKYNKIALEELANIDEYFE
jgi:hypothetical protein